MKRIVLILLLSGVASFARAQHAGPENFKSGRELLAAPGRHLNKPVTIVIGFCFFDDTNTKTYTCIGDQTPFEVQASSIPEGPAQNAIKATCGDIQGIEHNPSPYCAFSFKFVATSQKTIIGD